jgi:1,4-dihydroxy-2-naphthoate octaprenyltransferase
MSGMSYYLSRALISATLGGLLAMTGSSWWVAALVGAAAFVLFLWAPVSGRYVVDPERGATALGRDERSQAIVGKASRNAFAVTIFLLAVLTLYFGVINPGSVPIHTLSLVLFLGALTYFVSDLWFRRT